METIVNGRVLQPGCRLNQYAEPLRIVVPFVKALARTDDLGIAAPVVVIARNPYRQNIFDNGNADGQSALQIAQIRSEERRVGKACVSTCRFRWSRYH